MPSANPQFPDGRHKTERPRKGVALDEIAPFQRTADAISATRRVQGTPCTTIEARR